MSRTELIAQASGFVKGSYKLSPLAISCQLTSLCPPSKLNKPDKEIILTDTRQSVEALKQVLGEVFAPMIQALNIEPVEITDTGARFALPESDFVVRGGDIVCGQALASVADTVGVLALIAHNSPSRMMTTVDMTTHFMRPLFKGAVDVEATILSNGRRMATVRIDMRQQGAQKVAAATTCAYAYVE